jgi:hypothetical protein
LDNDGVIDVVIIHADDPTCPTICSNKGAESTPVVFVDDVYL